MASTEAGAAWERSADWMPKVSAILPCYKAEAFISRTLASLAAQTWPDLEILIGDDASPDGTLGIVEDFAARHHGARVIARRRNLGWVGNTNALMGEASGELMFFAWHDDPLAPSYVERLVAALRENSRAILAFSDVEVLTPEGGRSLLVFDALSGVENAAARTLRMAMRPSGYWAATHGLFRREAFERIGGLRLHEAGEAGASWLWLLRMATLGQFERVPEPLCQHVFQTHSLSRRWENSPKEHIALERAAVRTIRESHLAPVPKALVMALVTLTFAVKHRAPPLYRWLVRPLKRVVMGVVRMMSPP